MPDQSQSTDDINQRLDPTPGRETAIEAIAETAAAVSTAVVAEQAEQTEARTAAAVERRIKPLTALLLVMMGVSLLIHALTLSRLFAVRNTLKDEIGRLATTVENAKQEQITYDFTIDQTIPINVVIPINESVVIPVNTTVEIKQDVNIPIDTGFGVYNLPVPLDVSIPISTSVPIDFQQNVPISTSIDLQLTVPIEIDLGSPQFADYLDRLHKALLDLEQQF
ncbi:MAG: hypothetical protein H0T53_04705 [Herpetosiphonaceae bacterium]|nr:hypothetical protein [Herpetosiphonaceae bacterium]